MLIKISSTSGGGNLETLLIDTAYKGPLNQELVDALEVLLTNAAINRLSLETDVGRFYISTNKGLGSPERGSVGVAFTLFSAPPTRG